MKHLSLLKKLLFTAITCIHIIACSSDDHEIESDIFVEANVARIHVTQAGTLSKLMNDCEKNKIEDLTLSGYLNGSDILYLKEELSKTLFKLNLSDAKIVEGGEPYAMVTEKYYTKNDEISDYFFSTHSYPKLHTIILPKDCTRIGKYSLTNLTNLSFVELPNALEEIDNIALYNCLSLKSVIFPSSLLSIGDYCFQNCQELTSIQFNNSLQKIGFCAFQNCKSLTNINLPNSLNSIGQFAFDGCSNLSTITISEGITEIQYGTFRNCVNLSSVNLPTSLNAISISAFEGCLSLKTITIPQNVNKIEYDTFSNCNNLQEIHLKGTTPPDISYWSNDYMSHCTLFIPKGSLAAYKKTNYWSLFYDIIEE